MAWAPAAVFHSSCDSRECTACSAEAWERICCSRARSRSANSSCTRRRSSAAFSVVATSCRDTPQIKQE